MAIKIKNLEQLASEYTTQRYVFKDLFLDINLSKIQSPGYPLPVPGADIKASFDVGAITNSLTNLFNTLPGQRFLFPEYGLDLHRFLFEPMSDFNAEILGRKILNGIETYESRVKVLQVRVIPDYDNNLYNITIMIEIPILSTTTQTQFSLDLKKQTFIFVPTSRNQ
jgi:phage baseplate assembly protein W